MKYSFRLKQFADILVSSQINIFGFVLSYSIMVLIGLCFLTTEVSGEVKRQMNYGSFPEDDQMKKDRAAFEEATKGEHPQARMERLAHGYAYGRGRDDNWHDKDLRRQMNIDGFDIVETMIDKVGGAAGMVVKDRKTGRHVIVFRGTDTVSELIDDLNETVHAEVGTMQYSKNKDIFNDWAEKYSQDGKLDVTGHSLGGGLAHIFTSFHGDKIKKVATFQSTAQEKATLDRYNEIPLEERPEQIILTVAAPDTASHVGTEHAGVTKVIAASGSKMGIKNLYGHISFLLQNKGVKDFNGSLYRSADDDMRLLDLTPKQYQKNRKPNILNTNDTWTQWNEKRERMQTTQWRNNIIKNGKDPSPSANGKPEEQNKNKDQMMSKILQNNDELPNSDCSNPSAATVEAVNNYLAGKTPSEVASLSLKLLPQKDRKAFMNCLCAATSKSSPSVWKYYDPKPVNASPSCNEPSNGACVNQGFGCNRHSLKVTKEALEACDAGQWVIKQLCEPGEN